MLDLSITWAEGELPSREQNPAPDIAVWADQDGNPAAYCYRRNGVRHIDLPGVGSYRFGQNTDRIIACVSPLASRETIVDGYRRLVVPLALQEKGYEVLHASAVSMPSGVIAFCGPSGVGKSTLAWALGQRGHVVRADDVVALTFETGSPSLIPLPFALRLSKEDRAALGETPEPPPNDEIAGQPLAAVVALERVSGVESSVAPTPQFDAFRVLFAHGLCFSEHQTKRLAIMVERYLALAATVPTYRARSVTNLALLSDVLDQIEALFG